MRVKRQFADGPSLNFSPCLVRWEKQTADDLTGLLMMAGGRMSSHVHVHIYTTSTYIAIMKREDSCDKQNKHHHVCLMCAGPKLTMYVCVRRVDGQRLN